MVFVSWSGQLSGEIAAAIRELFPQILQGLEIFMSEADIQDGTPWFESITKSLERSNYGIIVLTRENLARPWVLFEAGALAKGIDKSRVTPLVVDVEKSDLGGPLGHFHAATLQRADIRKLLFEINSLREAGPRLSDTQFERTFDKWWPDDLHKTFDAIRTKYQTGEVVEPAVRSDREILVDLISEVRTLSSQTELQTNILTHLWTQVMPALPTGTGGAAGFLQGLSGGGGDFAAPPGPIRLGLLAGGFGGGAPGGKPGGNKS